ncbi:MAG: hypothetical protein ACR2FY_03340 [Pirellulaceae bacterium]
MATDLKRGQGTTAWALRLSIGAACLSLSTAAVLAHHGSFYKPVYQAIRDGDLDKIKDRFSKSAWEGECGALSAAELQERLKKGKVSGLWENSSRDEERSRCLVAFKIEYADKRIERIWLLAEDTDKRHRQWDWRIVRIVNDGKQAQAFFKHSSPMGW